MLSLLRRIARGSNLSVRPRFAILLRAESKRWSVSSILHCEVEPITPRKRQDSCTAIMAMLNRSHWCLFGNLCRFALGIHDEKTIFCFIVPVYAVLVGNL